MNLNKISRRTAVALALSLSTSAFAQNWPDKPIRIVVGFAPGGFTDVLARTIGQKLQERLGQSVVVDNKAGAAGTVGADIVAKARPDGYTLLLGHSNSNSVAPAIYPKLPYDVVKDFTPIIRVASTPLLLTVNPGVPATDVKSFVALAKQKPMGLSFASSGSGSAQHLAAARFMLATQTQMNHIPYKGSGQAIVDLLSGQVNLNFESPPNVLPHYQAGKLRVLGHWGTGSLASLPEVPALKDTGFNAEYAQWSGLFIPSATPEPVAQRIRAAARAAAQDAKVREVILGAGSPVQFQDSPDFEKYVQADAKRMVDVVKKIGKVE